MMFHLTNSLKFYTIKLLDHKKIEGSYNAFNANYIKNLHSTLRLIYNLYSITFSKTNEPSCTIILNIYASVIININNDN